MRDLKDALLIALGIVIICGILSAVIITVRSSL